MSCPAQGDRRATREDETTKPRVALEGGLWRIRSLNAARQVLRARHQTTQAGFTAEYIPKGRLQHRPILISDGAAHDQQRSEVARFFAPAVIEERYGDQIRAAARRWLDETGARPFSLDDLALYFTVDVTAEIVGLTHTTRYGTADERERQVRAMAHRLVSFFD
ncbi:MAG TPA: cytochrome P450, partial [Candidatus Luteococcus avicola]|nr:cytochrome P450 [Candidatus Luteococcus avicola]